MDSKVTTLAWMTPSNEIPSGEWLGPFFLESLTISHALLPVLCAVFITIVIVVIACCLIQRKPKPARGNRSHTIETSHDASDNDMYDVIDEVNVSTLPLRCNDKLDSNFLIGAQLLQHSKVGDIFTTSPGSSLNPAPSCDVKSENTSQHRYREEMWRQPESVISSPRQACLPNQPGWHVNCSEVGPEDEGIYETLDRHWPPITERREQASVYTEDKNRICNPLNVDSHISFKKDNHHHVNTNDTFECNRKLLTQNGGNNYHNLAASDKVCPVLSTTSTSSQNKEANKIICQLSMFKLSGRTHEKPMLIEKAYYHVQSQRNPFACSHFEEISAMFQSENLRIVQSDLSETPVNSTALDLVLQPAKVLGYPFREKVPQLNIMERTQEAYQMHHAAAAHCHAVPARKSQPVRAVSLDISYTQKHPSNHQCVENSQTAPECSATKHRNITKSPEAARISTKLGPLPPLPVQYNVSCEKEKSNLTSFIMESNCLHPKQSLTSPISACPLQLVQNRVSPQPFIITAPSRGHSQQMDVALCVSRPQVFSDKRSKANIVTKEVNSASSIDPSTNIVSRNFPHVSQEIVYVADMHNNCGNTKLEYGSDNYNDYFVLESVGDVCSLNSYPEDTPD